MSPCSRMVAFRWRIALSGWDCPVVLHMRVPAHELKKHLTLANGTDVNCWKQRFGTVIDLSNYVCEIHIHEPLYNRLRRMCDNWQLLELGKLVLCRTKRYNPTDVFTDNPGPSTCGRVVATTSDEFMAWRRAHNTKQYRCPHCDAM